MDCVIETIGKAEQGCTWTSLLTWNATAEDIPELFHIGVVYPAKHLYDESGLFQFRSERAGYDFLLITVSGQIIAWKIRDDRYPPADIPKYFLTEEQPAEAKYVEVATWFLTNRLGEPLSLDQQIYSDDQYQPRIATILPDFSEINEQLISYLGAHPEILHEMHWRKFEELLTELFRDMGYEVELGPGRGDEGVDIRLVSKDSIGQILTLVQAKKHNPKYPVSLQPVQAMYGALEVEGANRGVLVSTSGFQPAARRWVKNKAYRLKLIDSFELQKWIHNYRIGS